MLGVKHVSNFWYVVQFALISSIVVVVFGEKSFGKFFLNLFQTWSILNFAFQCVLFIDALINDIIPSERNSPVFYINQKQLYNSNIKNKNIYSGEVTIIIIRLFKNYLLNFEPSEHAK